MKRNLTPWDLRTNGEPVDCLALINQVDDLDEIEELRDAHLQSDAGPFAPILRHPAKAGPSIGNHSSNRSVAKYRLV